ncbi:MAG TPA: hypothetical protein DG753_03230, partial [Clostridium sp.]|nr:hypothetical protein [Clostridium sp.]
MIDFTNKIRLRSLIFIYVVTQILALILSEAELFKNISLLTDDAWITLSNFVVLIWIMWKVKINSNDIESTFVDFKQKINSKEIFILLSLNILITLSSITLIISIILKLMPNMVNELLSDTSSDFNVIPFIISSVMIVLSATILEEIMFRGILLKKIASRGNLKKAIIISSAIFGILHPSLGIISAFITGVILGLLYIKYNNILIPMLLHILHNSVIQLITLISSVYPSTDTEVALSTAQINICLILSIIILVVSSI